MQCQQKSDEPAGYFILDLSFVLSVIFGVPIVECRIVFIIDKVDYLEILPLLFQIFTQWEILTDILRQSGDIADVMGNYFL